MLPPQFVWRAMESQPIHQNQEPSGRALKEAIRRYIRDHNAKAAKPFMWPADPDKIIAAVRRRHQTLDSNH